MEDNVAQILQMLQSGKITAQEAQSLIEAVNNRPVAESSASSWGQARAGQEPPRSEWSGSSPTAVQTLPPPQAVPPPPASENRQPKLSPGDLLLQIADDPSIREDEKLTIIIHASALLCTVLAVQPIPGLDLFFFTPVMVATAVAMSRVMGTPIGKNGAGEIVGSVLGVVGLGIVAEQVFILGAKIALPIFGVMALLPLLYATTYGVGYTLRAVLDARRNNQQISNEELRRIKTEAEQRAKSQQRDWTLTALKRELDEWIAKGEEFKQYEQQYEDLHTTYAKLLTEMDSLSTEVMSLSQQKMTAEARLHELMDLLKEENLTEDARNAYQEEGERLQQEYETVNPKWSEKGLELEQKRVALEQSEAKIIALLQSRFGHAYPHLAFAQDTWKALASLPLERLRLAERQIATLEFEPAKAFYVGEAFQDSQGRFLRIVRFDEQGQFYTMSEGSQVTIRRVGKPSTEARDIAWLQSSRA